MVNSTALQPQNNKALINLFEEFSRVLSNNINSIKIGIIQTYNKEKQTVSVQIAHKKKDAFSIDNELLEYSVLPEVPVIFIGGSGTHITYPIVAGDFCVLMFSDHEIDGWWVSGEARPSETNRTHDLSDAVALVGIRNNINFIQGLSDFLELHYSNISHIVVGESIDITNATTNVSEVLNVGGDTNIQGNTLGVGAVTFQDTLTVTKDITGQAKITGELHDTRVANGSFQSGDMPPKTITVVDGIITSIA